MATAYDTRVVRPLNAERVIEAGERILETQEMSAELRSTVEQNLERMRGGPDEELPSVEPAEVGEVHRRA